MTIHFKALPTEDVRRLQHGGADAYGFTPERKISDGDGVPCRHCLRNVAAGDEYLILAYRPFPALQPYAETGPIFLHAERVRAGAGGRSAARACSADAGLHRARLRRRRPHRLRHRRRRADAANPRHAPRTLLGATDIAYVHMRSARNNCYQCRIDRG